MQKCGERNVYACTTQPNELELFGYDVINALIFIPQVALRIFFRMNVNRSEVVEKRPSWRVVAFQCGCQFAYIIINVGCHNQYS